MDKSVASTAPLFDAGEAGRELMAFLEAQRGQARTQARGARQAEALLREARIEAARQLAAGRQGRAGEGLAAFQDELIRSSRLHRRQRLPHDQFPPTPSDGHHRHRRLRHAACSPRSPTSICVLLPNSRRRGARAWSSMCSTCSGPGAEGRPRHAQVSSRSSSRAPTSRSAPPARCAVHLGDRSLFEG